VVYKVALKRVALVDVFVIALGFVLRAVAGAVVLAVAISPWLLLCAFLLALFLALCKRRHEKVLVSDTTVRESLDAYNAHLLDLLISITAAATIVVYAIYTLSPETCQKFQTHGLGFTIPFVMFGIFRYLDLVYRHEKGERPEKILLTDIPILVNLALYALCTALVFLFRG
jgi:4-hydroxybenzoate polyprenyltransferase